MKRSKCSKCILGRGSRKKKEGIGNAKALRQECLTYRRNRKGARENTSMSEGQGLPLSPLR